MSEIHLLQGDCLEILPTLPDMSVDAIITDVPYGTTACKWDVIIPLDKMWAQVKRLCKGVFVTTASQPFTSVLIMSNLDWFKYEWVWEKDNGTNFYNAPYQPLKTHENIVVFSSLASSYSPKGSMSYNPQFLDGKPYTSKQGRAKHTYHDYAEQHTTINNGTRYPRSVINLNTERGLHPTQKPVALYEYLIKTYTNPGDTVLDFCAGSGTTIVAAIKTGRNVIGIEKEPEYFEIMERRATDTQLQMVMPL
jgi:site-specific DNA-methyltransferase (adenine-specific)